MSPHSPPSSGTDVTFPSAPSPQSSEGRRCCSSREDAGRSLDPDTGDGAQEEIVQTCLKAIASLKITTEDPH